MNHINASRCLVLWLYNRVEPSTFLQPELWDLSRVSIFMRKKELIPWISPMSAASLLEYTIPRLDLSVSDGPKEASYSTGFRSACYPMSVFVEGWHDVNACEQPD